MSSASSKSSQIRSGSIHGRAIETGPLTSHLDSSPSWKWPKPLSIVRVCALAWSSSVFQLQRSIRFVIDASDLLRERTLQEVFLNARGKAKIQYQPPQRLSGSEVDTLNGFPVTRLIHRIANDLTSELVRVRSEVLDSMGRQQRERTRLQDYRSVKRAVLVAEVQEVVASALYAWMPTLYEEYRKEKSLRGNGAIPQADEQALPSEAHHTTGGES